MLKRIPAIITDIDGVLIRGTNKIAHSAQAIEKIQKAQIPFLCLTNGGGYLESEKTEKVNKILGLQDSRYKISSNQMIMNYSPLRNLIQPQIGKQNNIIAGVGNIQQIATSIGISQYLTIDEYSTLEQSNQGLNKGGQVSEQIQKEQAMEQRWQIDKDSIQHQYQKGIDNIFILNDPTYTEQIMQLLINALNSQSTPIDLYITNPDIIYQDQLALPRFSGFGCLIKQIESLVIMSGNKHTDRIVIRQCGKPTIVTFEYTQRQVERLYKDRWTQIGGFYMIGDNPNADVQGGNNMKERDDRWKTVLVETGVYRGQKQGLLHRPDYFVKDFREAVDFIIDRYRMNDD